MVRRKHCRLNFFQQWLSEFLNVENYKLAKQVCFSFLAQMFLEIYMSNVKFLQLNYIDFLGTYKHFPKNLIWLCWHGFSLGSTPNHLCLEKLVVLDLSRSCLVDDWKDKLVCIWSLSIAISLGLNYTNYIYVLSHSFKIENS